MRTTDTSPKILAEKVWCDHVVKQGDNGKLDPVYIDLHLVHEVTLLQTLDGPRLTGRKVRRPDLTIITENHNVLTTVTGDKIDLVEEPTSHTQTATLRRNAEESGIRLHPMGGREQGIVYVIGPQLGLTQPDITIVCGDSYTMIHGTFGAVVFSIGTSEVEYVLAIQTLSLKPFKAMAVNVTGEPQDGVTAKDLILTIIAKIGTGGGQGHVIECRGKVIEGLSMEARMTICNMFAEAGACAGMIVPDETTFEYLKGRLHVPQGEQWDEAIAYWKFLVTDEDVELDKVVEIDGSTLTPFVTWGTNPGQGAPPRETVPDSESIAEDSDRIAAEYALEYMDLKPGTLMRDISIGVAFVDSCTNGHIEDTRVVADVLGDRKVADGAQMLIMPGFTKIRTQAEGEGLDRIFEEADTEWCMSGCFICLGTNPDQLTPDQRCASALNRSFEGRQDKGGRTHLVGSTVAATVAIAGHFAAPANL